MRLVLHNLQEMREAPRVRGAEFDEQCLKQLRREGVECPADEVIDCRPLELGPLNLAGRGVTEDLRGSWLAIDLDDTLLVGSLTNADAWGALGEAVPGLRKERLATDWPATAKRLARGRIERVVSRKAHAFIAHPKVEVAFRPGMLEGLARLRSRGLGLALVTASARKRVDWLVRRFPVIGELFTGALGRIVVAEDLAEAAFAAESGEVDHEPSARAHRLRPRSLAAKTPWAVSRAAAMPFYDLLLDDSEVTARLFQEAGLEERLLWVEGGHPWSNYGPAMVEAALIRLLGTQPAPSPGRLPCPAEALGLPRGAPRPVKVEDPLYYPLLHYRDQLDGSS